LRSSASYRIRVSNPRICWAELLYLDPKRVCSIQTGKRDRVIDVGDLRAAYEALRDELPRSGVANRRSSSAA
jgi:hypothetical protein